MRPLRIFTVFLLVALTSAVPLHPAAAATSGKNSGMFSADIPSDWSIREQGGDMILSAPDRRCMISISLSTSEGLDAKTIADEVRDMMKASKPKKEKDGSYTMLAKISSEYVKNDKGEREIGEADARITVREKDGLYLVMVVVGAHPNLANIIKSMRSDDPRVQALFK